MIFPRSADVMVPRQRECGRGLLCGTGQVHCIRIRRCARLMFPASADSGYRPR